MIVLAEDLSASTPMSQMTIIIKSYPQAILAGWNIFLVLYGIIDDTVYVVGHSNRRKRKMQTPRITRDQVLVLDTTDVRDIRIQINASRGLLKGLDNQLAGVMDKEKSIMTTNQIRANVDKILATLEAR
jgi:hypothetical protein